jgi:20S proteasome alpha/beta subunit
MYVIQMIYLGSLNAWNALCIGKNSEKVMESLAESFGTEKSSFGIEENEKIHENEKFGIENMSSKTIVT